MANRNPIAPPAGKPEAARLRKSGSRNDGETKHALRLSPEKRKRLVAEAAYFIAERRGFAAGREFDDWLQAEAEVSRRVGGSRSG